jgi:DNA-binding transcriptional LysR family regulator
MFHRHAIAPRIVQFIGSTHTIVALVNSGLAVALVPESACNLRFDRVEFRKISLDAGVRAELHLVGRQENDNPALEAVRVLVLAKRRKSARSGAQEQ